MITFDETMEQQQLQTRLELILGEVLRNREYRSSKFRNAIEDLLLTTNYEWKENAFGFPISIDGLRKLFEEICNLVQTKQNNRKIPKEHQQQVSNREFVSINLKARKSRLILIFNGCRKRKRINL